MLHTYEVSFDNKGNWGTVYAYTFSYDGENVIEYSGAWPGTEVPVSGGFFNRSWTYSFAAQAQPQFIIWNNGLGEEWEPAEQTDDLPFVNGKKYSYYPEITSVKISGSWNGWNGPEMEYIEYSDNAYQTTVNLKEYADDQEFKLVVNGQWIGSGELSAIEGNEASCVIEGEFMGNNLNSGLFVKNVTDEQLYLRMAYEVIDIDNGTFQICFPSTCNVQSKPGVYTTAAGRLDSGQEGNIQSEWYPESYGHCTVRFQIEQMEMTGTFPRQTWTKVADGPSVTVIFDYAAPTAIGAVKYVATQSQQTERMYDLQGCPAVHPSRVRGLLIERLPDGTTRKRVCR